MALRAAALEVLFTAKTDDLGRAEKDVRAMGQRVEKKPITAKVDGDASGALESMDRVEAAGKKVVSAKTVATVDANIERAEKSFMRVYERLDYLRSVETELDVSADIRRAEAAMSKVQRNLDGLRSARAVMVVDADTAPAEDALDGARDAAGDAGAEAGEEFGDEIVAALLSIPIAGAVIGVGVAAGKALIEGVQDGLQVERRIDRLAALAGLDEASAGRFARAAGESYANVFGESIEANMDTARLALQFGILDERSTTESAERVISSLAGIADVLGEDVRPIATAVTTLLKSGLVSSADEAFDVLATGAREGVNRGEDLVDTFIEYPALFARLGLSAEEALGLLNQGLDAGARNSDFAADALKEFQIRATDASELSAAGFERLGLDAEEMTAKIARGGAEARAGLGLVLDRLRETEDPVVRNAAAVELFGTKAEDLGDALYAMDLSTAVDELDGVTGAAQRMFDTLNDNDATRIEQAQRNLEVAADGIKGALAAAFSEPLTDLSEWVSSNRGPLLQFFSDMVNGAIDFAIAANEGVGSFVAGPLVDLIEGLKHVVKVMNPFADTSDLEGFIDGMRDFESVTDAGTWQLERMREQFNGFAEGQIAMGYLNDASLRLAESIDIVDGSSENLEAQVRAVIAALESEISAAEATGESQDELTARYNSATGALFDQMVQTGLSEEAAQELIDTVLSTPEDASTEFSSNANSERTKVQNLADRIVTLPDGSVIIQADTTRAQQAIDAFIRNASGRTIGITAQTIVGNPSLGYTAGGRTGGIVQFAGGGFFPDLVPMDRVAQTVSPGTWRVVGDRTDVEEIFAPLDGSPRSWSVLMEGLRRMPGSPPGAGAGDMRISGSLDLGGGLVGFVDGVLRSRERDAARRMQVGDRRKG